MQTRQWAVLFGCALASVLATDLSQAQVREASGSRGQAAPAQQSGNNDLIVSMYNQIEALQQEVQTLRGVVEEQGYQLKRLQTEQRDRYLDIDRRLSTLSPPAALPGGVVPVSPDTEINATAASQDLPAGPVLNSSSAALASAVTVETPAPVTLPATVTPVTPASSGSQPDEQELYRTALNLLLEESKYDESIATFQSYIDQYPQGRLFTNALYWQGEAYLLVNGFSQAKDVFSRLLNEFPQDAKAAGAMLKLGMAQKQMGDPVQAGETWRALKTRFPENANEMRLAEEYLKAL